MKQEMCLDSLQNLFSNDAQVCRCSQGVWQAYASMALYPALEPRDDRQLTWYLKLAGPPDFTSVRHAPKFSILKLPSLVQ